MEIEGSVAVITGAAGTIGSAIARDFAERGARLVLADRDGETLERVATDVSGRTLAGQGAVKTVVGDVSDEAHHRQLVDVADSLGGLDISVLNAGVYLPGLAWEIPLEQWRLHVDVNFWGVLHGVRAAVPAMIERGRGHVVAVASGAGLVATPGLSAYVATKHAVVGLMESVRHELNRVAPFVGASVVCPGNVRSDMAANSLAAADISEQRLDGTASSIAADVQAGNDGGTGPEVVATAVADAISSNKFWVLSHPEIGWVAVDRMERLRDGEEPVDLFG